MSVDIDELLARPNFADLPLGTLAGRSLRYVKTPQGNTLHGGYQCSYARNPGAIVREFTQPSSGTLADLNLPSRAHCHWDSDAFAYIRAARGIAGLRDQNDAAATISSEDVTLDLLRGAEMPTSDEPPVAGLTSALRPAWIAARDQRERAIAEMTGPRRWNVESAVTSAVVARWVAAGRVQREYDPQYQHFLDQVDVMLEPYDLRAGRKYRDVLTGFLEHVGHGGALGTAADALEGKFDLQRNVPTDVPSPARAVIAHWGGMLRAVASAYPGKCLAVIEYSHHSWWRETSLHDMYVTLWGGARFRGAGVDWVACMVPRAHQLLLHDLQRRASSGLMFHDVWHVDVPEAGAALLRHVVRERVGSGLVDSVTTIPPASMPFLPDLEWHRGSGNATRPAPDLRNLTVSGEFIEMLQAMWP